MVRHWRHGWEIVRRCETRDEANVVIDELLAAAAKATSEVYRLNLGYTKVYSPISGQASRAYYDAGNLVTQDQTLLTTVVSTDPAWGTKSAQFAAPQPFTINVPPSPYAAPLTVTWTASAGAVQYAPTLTRPGSPIDPGFAHVWAYRKRLLARPSVARAVDEARPYRSFFPLGAPDRD